MSDISTGTTPEKTGIFEQSPGVLSSKRIAGAALLVLGAGLLLATGIIALFRATPMPNADISIKAGLALVGIGGGLLGLTIADNFSETRTGGGA